MGGPNQTTPQVSADNVNGERYLRGGSADPSQTPQGGGPGDIWIKVDPVAPAQGGTIGLLQKKDYGDTSNWTHIPTEININGNLLDSSQLEINFTGAGVTVTKPGPGQFTVNIPGGGGASIDVQDNGASVVNPASILNFTGGGVTVSDNGGGEAEINIPSPATQEKFTEITAEAFGNRNNAKRNLFKDFEMVSLGPSGFGQIISSAKIQDYIVGEDIDIDLYFIADGGGTGDVHQEVEVLLFQAGDDIDVVTPFTVIDIYTPTSTDGEAFTKSYTVTAADLGNPASGNYQMRLRVSRDGGNAADSYNRRVYAHLAKISWG